jgi:hypothetical protein
MAATPSTTSTAWTYSSRRNPCPICGRTKDGDCRISVEGDRVTCHHPRDLKPGEVVNGWAFTGNTSDDRAAHFVLDRPREASRRLRVVNGRNPAPVSTPVAITGPITLARLPEGVAVPDLNREKATYHYSNDQQTLRNTSREGGKVLPFHREGDQRKAGAGPDPWPMYQQDHALAAAGWILELEGERKVGLAMAAGLVAISQPGHNHSPDSISARYRTLAEARLPGVVYVSDNDTEGQRKAERCAAAAAEVGLPFLHLPASKVWPGIAEKGSIDDAPGTAAEQIAAIEAAIVTALQGQPAAEEALREVPKEKVRRHRLAPDEVLAQLPERIGSPRFNVRSQAIHLPDRMLSANDASRLYLELSTPSEAWPKEPTADALALLAHRARFDPVAEYLEGITADPLPMDDWERLDLAMLNGADSIARWYLPRFLIAAVARVFEPGCIARSSPVLIGPQERGKTELGRILFGADHYVEGVNDLGKDALLRCQTAWGVELGELNGVTRRTDQERLKAFLSERFDTVRRPYDRAPEQHPRRFVFWGTSNAAPLRDFTGSTRFVCIPIPDRLLPLDWVKANRDAIWARALERYRAGVRWDQTTEDERAMVADRNLDHLEIDPWAEPIAAFLEKRRVCGRVTLVEAMEELELPASHQNGSNGARVRALIEACGWVWARRQEGGSRLKGFWAP